MPCISFSAIQNFVQGSFNGLACAVAAIEYVSHLDVTIYITLVFGIMAVSMLNKMKKSTLASGVGLELVLGVCGVMSLEGQPGRWRMKTISQNFRCGR